MSFLNLNLKKENTSSPKTDAYVQQAQNVWSMLDDMAANDPKAYKSFIENTLKEGKEAMKSPESNMCVMVTVTIPKKYKLYINFFEWIRIPAPKTDEDPIPVYGHKILELKNNESVVNIAFHPEILTKYGKKAENAEEQKMLINLAFQYIEEINKVSIDADNFKVLKETICFGDKDKNASMLSKDHAKSLSSKAEFNAANEALKAMESNQMPDEETIFNNLSKLNINPNSKKSGSEIVNENKKPLIEDLNPTYEVPKYNVELIEKIIDDNHDTLIQVKIHLSKIYSIKECDLSIENKIIKLIANPIFYKALDISLQEYESKFHFDLEQLDAKFIKKTCMLKLLINAKKLGNQ